MEQRIINLDLSPDPDGRYRVNEFFCHVDTWQMAMSQLTQLSDSVLMDLRSFSRQNAGCIYELQYLINNVPLNQIMLIIDNSTDRKFFEETIESIKRNLSSSFNNLNNVGNSIQLYNLKEETFTKVTNLLKLLFNIRYRKLELD